jgi:ABC-type glycerol-3-phosphate transport system substrate-binding protein
MVKKNKAITVAGSILLSLTLILSACSGNSTKEAPNSPGASASNNPKKPVILSISWWGGDTRHAANQKALELFHKKYDWIKVEPTFSGFEGYHDKLTVQLSAQKSPDVFLFSRAQTQNYGRSDALLNFYDHKSDLPFITELDSMMQSPFYKVGDKLLGLPAGITSNVVVYNKKVYDDAKVAYPTDKESWMSLSEKWTQVHKANSKVYGGSDWYSFPDMYALLMKQLDAEMINGSVTPPVATVNADKAKLIWNWMEKLWADGVVPRNTSDKVSFETGNLATSISASSAAVTTVNLTPDPLGFAVLPATFDGTGTKVVNPPVPSGLWGVSASSPHVKEALLLVNFLMTDPDAVKATGIENGVPATTKAMEILTKEVVKQGTPQYEMVDVVRRSQDGVSQFWLPAQPLGAPEAGEALKTSLEKYLFKKTTMEQFIAESQTEMNKIFQKVK